MVHYIYLFDGIWRRLALSLSVLEGDEQSESDSEKDESAEGFQLTNPDHRYNPPYNNKLNYSKDLLSCISESITTFRNHK